MTGSTTLPDVAWAGEAWTLARTALGPALANHCARSWRFACLLAEHEGLTGEVDESLVFAATIMHDMGLRPWAVAPVRFEVDGADHAAAFLAERGLGAADVDLVWEAIALHTSDHIAERRGPVAYLTRRGIGADLGRASEWVTDAQGRAVHAEFPRLDAVHAMVELIVAQCRAVPERGPRFSAPGELAREREATGSTQLEAAAAGSRWGR